MLRGNINLLSIDTEYNVIKDNNGCTRKELFSVSIAATNIDSVIRALNSNTSSGSIEVYHFPMYNRKWFSTLSDFWLEHPDALNNCVYNGKIRNYSDLCKSVCNKIKRIFDKYRNMGPVRIIAGVSADADILRMLDNDIFNVNMDGKNIYVDPIIVKSLFSSKISSECVNPYSSYYGINRKAKQLCEDLKKAIIGKTNNDLIHNSDYDAMLNICNFLALSGYII